MRVPCCFGDLAGILVWKTTHVGALTGKGFLYGLEGFIQGSAVRDLGFVVGGLLRCGIRNCQCILASM